MKYAFVAAAAALSVCAPVVGAQEAATAPAATVAPAAAVITPAATNNAVLRAGTPVALRLMEEVTTKKKAARVGQRHGVRVVRADRDHAGEAAGDGGLAVVQSPPADKRAVGSQRDAVPIARRDGDDVRESDGRNRLPLVIESPARDRAVGPQCEVES